MNVNTLMGSIEYGISISDTRFDGIEVQLHTVVSLSKTEWMSPVQLRVRMSAPSQNSTTDGTFTAGDGTATTGTADVAAEGTFEEPVEQCFYNQNWDWVCYPEGTGYDCYYDNDNDLVCTDPFANFDNTLIETAGTAENCYDSAGAPIPCYYDTGTTDSACWAADGTYTCDATMSSSGETDCYWDEYDNYICTPSTTDSTDCYWDEYGNQICSSTSTTDGTDCYYDEYNNYVCGSSSTESCYWDEYDNYICEATSSTAAAAEYCYWNENDEYVCEASTEYCYWDENDEYICESIATSDDGTGCYYDSAGVYICDDTTSSSDGTDCYWDEYENYICNSSSTDATGCYWDESGIYICDSTSTDGTGCYYDEYDNYICDPLQAAGSSYWDGTYAADGTYTDGTYYDGTSDSCYWEEALQDYICDTYTYDDSCYDYVTGMDTCIDYSYIDFDCYTAYDCYDYSYEYEYEFEQSIIGSDGYVYYDEAYYTEQTAALTATFESDDVELEDALGQILEVEDVQKATQDSQKLTQVDDDTDLEAAAQFDINAFFASRGVGVKSEKQSRVQQMPPLIFAQEAQKEFTIP